MPTRPPLTPQEFQAVADRALKTAPAGLSDADLDALIMTAANREEAAKAASVRPAAADLKFDASGVLSGFLSGAGRAVSGLVSAVGSPIETAKNALRAQFVDQPVKAWDALKQGHYSEAAGHAGAALLPIVGPAAADIGERMAQTGDVGEGVGEGAFLAGSASPTMAGGSMRALGKAAQGFGHAIAVPAKYAGAAEMFHGAPGIGAAVMAAPVVAKAIGRGAEAAGDSISALRERMGPSVSDAFRSLTDDGGETPRPAPNPDAGAPDWATSRKWDKATVSDVRGPSGVSGPYEETPPALRYKEQPFGASPEASRVTAPEGMNDFQRYLSDRENNAYPKDFDPRGQGMSDAEIIQDYRDQGLDPETGEPVSTATVHTTSTGRPWSNKPTFEGFRERGPDDLGPAGVSLNDVALMRSLIKAGYDPRTAGRISGAPASSIDSLRQAIARERAVRP